MGKRIRHEKERLYIAYGSNLNLEQMQKRCPTAEVIGTAVLHNFCLRFRGVATIEQEKGGQVPVLIWKLQPQDESALDRYEGWPHLYRKETLRITVNKKRVSAMVYIMNEHCYPYGVPSEHYFNIIMEGYKSAGFATEPLLEAARETTAKERKDDRNH